MVRYCAVFFVISWACVLLLCFINNLNFIIEVFVFVFVFCVCIVYMFVTSISFCLLLDSACLFCLYFFLRSSFLFFCPFVVYVVLARNELVFA